MKIGVQMATKTRILPFEEWDKLDDLPFMSNGCPDPNTTVIVVAETSDGSIVGVWGAFTPVVLDGLWIHEDYRHTSVAAKLLITMKDFLLSIKIPKAFTFTSIPEVEKLAQHAGFVPIAGNILMMPLLEENL